MASQLNPYLNFDGTARQAMERYRDVLGGELELHTFGEYGAPEGINPDGVMHATLVTAAGFTIMASDMPPGTDAAPGNMMSVSLSGDDETQLRGYWDGLSAGGTVMMPLEPQMWGDTFGMCIDQFGTPWMVNITGQQPPA